MIPTWGSFGVEALNKMARRLLSNFGEMDDLALWRQVEAKAFGKNEVIWKLGGNYWIGMVNEPAGCVVSSF